MSKTSNGVCRDTIKKSLATFHGEDSTIEVRILGVDSRKGRTDAGYFNSIESAADAVRSHAHQWHSKGVYFCINPVFSSLLARAKNRIQEYATTTTSDSDIMLRRWLYLDFDPVRPSDISSTDEEHNIAIQRANDVVDWMKEQGFPEPIVADSGNGAHLHFPIDLPHDSETTALVKAVTAEVARRFTDDAVTIDLSVFNAARICRLYGTWACKGDDTEDRPHRRSSLIYVPDYLSDGWSESNAAGVDLLTKLTVLTPKTISIPPKSNQINGCYHGGGDSIDLRRLLTERGVEFRDAEGSAEFPVKLHVQCPFNDSHIGKDAYVAQRASGAMLFHCSHNSCAHNSWQEFKAAIGIETRQQTPRTGMLRMQDLPPKDKPVAEPKLMTVKASEVEPKELDWLWLYRFLVGHINILGGDPGLGKSMILIDVAARASSGRDWPDGSPCQQCSVLYSTTEDGIEDTVVPRLMAAGADLERVHIVQAVKCRDDSELPLFLNEHLIYLDEMLTENPEIRILIVDTLQSHIGSAVATNNNSSVRGVMTPLKRLAEKHHIAVLCIEHLTKSKTMSGENATYRVQSSIAFAGAARSVWIVAKDQMDATGKRRYVQASKTNLAPDNSGLGLAYEICGPTGKPYVHWLETDVATPIDQLLSIPDATGDEQSDGGELGRCCDWLREILTEASPAKEVETGAKSEMISGRTLKRAKEQLGIRSEKRGSVWYWVPPADMEQARTDELIEAAES